MLIKFSIEDGEIKAEKSFRELFAKLKDGDYRLEVVRIRQKRSLNQNDFYWGPFLDVLAECMGETIPEMDEKSRESVKQEVHEMLKARFGECKFIRNPLDKRFRLKLPVSTAIMETKEFEEYLESIRVYFGAWGWALPYPDDGEPDTFLPES